MGNRSTENWSGMERLRFIERQAYWSGVVNRGDVSAVFGVSLAQASADMQRYLELNPEALVYSLNRKRYEATPQMKLILSACTLDEYLGAEGRSGAVGAEKSGRGAEGVELMVEALREDTGADVGGLGGLGGLGRSGVVDYLKLPERRASPEVEQRVHLATKQGRRLRIRYLSLHSGTDEWRWIRPHALAHNGYRWHVRAWCEKGGAYKDFILSRMVECEWPGESAPLPEPDVAWETWVILKLRPAQGLSVEQQRAIAHDYGMISGGMEIRVRQALEKSLRHQLRLPSVDGGAVSAEVEIVSTTVLDAR